MKAEKLLLRERQILKVLINEPNLINRLSIGSNHFTSMDHQLIFKTLLTMKAHSIPIDLVSVLETMVDQNEKWDQILKDISFGEGVYSHFDTYQNDIVSGKQQRDIFQVASEFYEAAKNNNSGAVTTLLKRVKQIEASSGSEATTVADAIGPVLQRIEDIQAGLIPPSITTGFTSLNEIVGGFNNGASYIVAARPNVGKTAIAINFAIKCGVPSRFISTETKVNGITQRVLSSLAGVSSFKMTKAEVTQSELGAMASYIGHEAAHNISVSDISRPTIDMVEKELRAAKITDDIQIAFIDYLQNIGHPTLTNPRERVTDISYRLKELALELDIPIVSLAQLSRGSEETKMPMLSHLKESSGIEESADVVMLLSNQYDQDGYKTGNLIVDVQKHREGPKAFVTVKWNPEFIRAGDLDHYYVNYY